jgi:hypothetical protein
VGDGREQRERNGYGTGDRAASVTKHAKAPCNSELRDADETDINGVKTTNRPVDVLPERAVGPGFQIPAFLPQFHVFSAAKAARARG